MTLCTLIARSGIFSTDPPFPGGPPAWLAEPVLEIEQIFEKNPTEGLCFLPLSFSTKDKYLIANCEKKYPFSSKLPYTKRFFS
jgi:hypothetical protein